MSEEELLLLSNYAYFYCSTEEGTIKDNINKLKTRDGKFDIEKVVAQGACGDIITEEAAVDILKRIESDDKIANLELRRGINSGGIRCNLYADQNDENATLVFRGTGGTYKAWEDNVLGEYKSDTKLQSLAADFVKYECGGYKDITVTGHSKGGNLSQYVTVVCSDQISKCVSFDGQGFSKEFLITYEDEIKSARGKITSINGFNDFVNILLTPIAGTILYVKNEESLSVNMHSCYTMLSNGSFDENGNFKRDFGVIPQLPAMTMAKWAGDGIVTVMNALPDNGNEKASKVLAAWVASIFSADKTEEYEQDKILTTISDFKKYAGGLLGICGDEDYVIRCCHDFFFMHIERTKYVYNAIDNITDKLCVYPEMIEDVVKRLDYSIAGRSFTDKALLRISEKLENNIELLRRMKEALGEIISCYETADMSA